ncbi:MAG: polysaccharide pyruvyl transferase family protein [Acidimicrobiales bacterium]
MGVNIAGLGTLAYHADVPIAGAGTFPAAMNLTAMLRGLVTELVARGHRVRLFCNGSAEDAAAVEVLGADPLLAGAVATGDVEIGVSPKTGRELARLVASCSAVVGHRLHSCVVAYSYGVPIVGLAWDRKVGDFFASVGLGSFMVEDPLVRSVTVADRVEAAILRGVDPEALAAVVKECRRGLQSAWEAGGLTVREGGPPS